MSSLYKKTLGGDPEIEFTVVSAGKPKTPSHFSGTLSFLYLNHLGDRIKLMFPLDITTDDYAVSCEEFVKLIAAYEQNLPDDSLGREIEFQVKAKEALTSKFLIERTCPTVSLLVFWDRHSQCFHVVDPSASGRSGKLVIKKIGNES